MKKTVRAKGIVMVMHVKGDGAAIQEAVKWFGDTVAQIINGPETVTIEPVKKKPAPPAPRATDP